MEVVDAEGVADALGDEAATVAGEGAQGAMEGVARVVDVGCVDGALEEVGEEVGEGRVDASDEAFVARHGVLDKIECVLGDAGEVAPDLVGREDAGVDPVGFDPQ